MAGKRNRGTVWGLIDQFEGDKVVLLVVLCLMLFSILAISSSTVLLTHDVHGRMDTIYEQLKVIGIGLVVIFLCYHINKLWFYRLGAQLSFIVALALLVFLFLGLEAGPIKAATINEAARFIIVGSKQINVPEVTKVLMVFYMAWASTEFKKHGTFTLTRLLSQIPRLSFLKKRWWNLAIYIFGPMTLVSLLTLRAGTSCTILAFVMMVVTILIGGIKLKDISKYILVCLAGGLLLLGLYKLTGSDEDSPLGKIMGKFDRTLNTAPSRINDMFSNPIDEIRTYDGLIAEERAKANPDKNVIAGLQHERDVVRDKAKQAISARVAISEGGFLGKGPGNSTQRYVVPIMYEDFMYSFIIEEYGIFGGILVLILYGCLLARSVIITRNCVNPFAKTMVAGLVILVSGQALVHIFINVGLFPVTGQTLPLISHGVLSFLVFSLVFGVILAISRMSSKRVNKELGLNDPIKSRGDDLQDGLGDLDELESL